MPDLRVCAQISDVFFFIRRFMLFLGQCVILCLLLYETVSLCLLCVQWDFFGVDFNFMWEDNTVYCMYIYIVILPNCSTTAVARYLKGPSGSYNSFVPFSQSFRLKGAKGESNKIVYCVLYILYSLQMMFQLQGANLHYNVDHKISVHKYEQLRICFLQNGCKIHVL